MDRLGKKKRLLRHHANIFPQDRERNFSYIMPIDQYRTFGCIIQPRNKIYERRFARTRSSDNCKSSTAWNFEIDMTQNIRQFFAIAERDILKFNIACDLADRMIDIDCIVNIRLCIEDHFQSCHRSSSALDHIRYPPQSNKWPGKHSKIDQECSHLTEHHCAVKNFRRTD